MIRSISLVFSVLLSVAIGAPTATPNSPWMDIVVMDCESKLHIAPSHPLLQSALDAKILTDVYQYAVDTITDRALCHCPSLDGYGVHQSFRADFRAVLYAWQRGTDNSTYRDQCGLAYSTDQAGLLWAKSLPTTCSYDRWIQGLPCNLQATLPPLNMNLQLSVSQCPAGSSSKFPFVSLTCSGQTCRDLMLPCSSDSDCLGSKCTQIGASSVEAVNNALSSFFDVTGLLPKADQHSCPSRWNASTVGLVQLDAMMKAVRSLTVPSASPASSTLGLKFCGIDKLAGRRYSDFRSIPFTNPGRLLSFFVNMANDNRVSSLFWPLNVIIGAIPNYAPWYAPRAIIADTYFFTSDLLMPIYDYFAGTISTTNGRVVWPGLVAWDGIMDNGQSATNPSRIVGNAFPALVTPTVEPLTTNPNYVPLLVSSCDMTVAVFPNQSINITARLPDFQSVLQASMYRARNLANCRNTTSDDQFRTYFDILALPFWQNLLTQVPGMPNVNVPGLGYTTPSSLLASVLNNVSMIIPQSCSFNTWMATGQCSGEYVGLNSLFSNLDLTLRWSISRCQAFPDALPSINLQCVGQDCAGFFTFNQLKACVQDAGCGSGGQCNFISNSLIGGVPGYLGQYWFQQQDLTCDNSNMDFLELINFKNKFTKQPIQQFQNINSIGYCSMVWQQNIVTNINDWLGNSYSISANNVVNVTGLQNYVPDSSTNPSSSTGVPAPADLPAQSKLITLVVSVPDSASPLFAVNLIQDIAADMVSTYWWSVSAQQLLPYLQFVSMNATIQPPESRRELTMSTFSFYLYGTINEVSATVPAATLASSFSGRVRNGVFLTPNSFAVVPVQDVDVQDAGNDPAGNSASDSQNAILPIVLIAIFGLIGLLF